MTQSVQTETGVLVTRGEVDEILADFRPGMVVLSTEVFRRYVRLMEGYRQPIASRVALGRALTDAGCQRTRKQRRVKGKMEETSCWTVPRTGHHDAIPTDRDQAKAALTAVGPGIRPNEEIYQAYLKLSREKGWRAEMSRSVFATILTKMGVHRMHDKGEPCRLVGSYL